MLHYPIFPQNIHAASYSKDDCFDFKQVVRCSLNHTLCYLQGEQVHGDRVVKIESNTLTGIITTVRGADGFVTDQRNIVLSVRHADCFPVFLFDPYRNVIGLVHSGWKGSFLEIAAKAVNLMSQSYGSNLADIKVAIGPGAQKCCYHFKKSWPHEQLLNDTVWKKHIFRSKKTPSYLKNVRKDNEEKHFVDLPGFIIQSLTQIGIEGENIENSNVCTVCNRNWYSWTRQRELGEPKANGVSIITLNDYEPI